MRWLKWLPVLLAAVVVGLSPSKASAVGKQPTAVGTGGAAASVDPLATQAAIDVPLLLAYGDGDLTRNFAGAFGHVSWRHISARFVGKIAREVYRFADYSSGFSATVQRLDISAINHNYDFVY